ncbi:MAG: RHS repeat-associated core domain-containing protein [Gemmataceae bacterium]
MTNPVTIRTYIGTGTGDAGDQYGAGPASAGVDLTWTTGGSGATVNDRYQYGYDRDSNRLWRDNVQNTAFGELYAYDALNQLTSMQRGTLNGTKTGLTGSASRSQSWTADGAGNFTTVTTDGTGQSRSYNAQNQFTALGSATPTYDNNGNLLTDGTWTYTYDAWNRLVSATNGTTTVTYGYDALGRRITETTGGTTTHLYYNQNWQVVEERVGGTASSNLRAQYVWSPVESDVLIYRDRDTNADGELDERLYAQQDAQGNVTALVNTSGTVVERYAYDAYGKATPYTASWGTPSGGTTQYAWQYLHQGLRYDAADALYDNRMRIYSAEYMRFLQNDPIGFAAGDPDTYRYVGNGPTGHTDPSGLKDDIDFAEWYANFLQTAAPYLPHEARQAVEFSSGVYGSYAGYRRQGAGPVESGVVAFGHNFMVSQSILAIEEMVQGKSSRAADLNSKLTGMGYARRGGLVALDLGSLYLAERGSRTPACSATPGSRRIPLTVIEPPAPASRIAVANELVIDTYGNLRFRADLPGQAHHLNQSAAYRHVIPHNQGIAIKLEGNVLTDAAAPHTQAHVSLEGFWNQYRGTPVVPTNLQYTRALQQSLRAAGLSESQVQQAVRAAIRERVDFGLLGGMEVPVVPRPIRNLAQ